jgi:RimJ/RimL family protein N-acetyltransferase
MIQTDRLTLIPLTLQQLETGLASIKQLSTEMNLPIVSDLISGNAERAVQMKIEKMRAAPPDLHAWFTYWLIVINKEGIGAGLVGFKGNPDNTGAVEIGYGINSIFQGRGYMSEAVSAMIGWAFDHPECKKITAIGVLPGNLASRKVLVKNEFFEVRSDTDGVDYELTKN